MANAHDTSSAKDRFLLSTDTGADCTHLYGEVQIAPAAIVRRFGIGAEFDGYKVSRQWIFRRGELVFTLYDWKSTNLYDVDMWSPEELWSSTGPFDLHVGSKEPATEEDVAEFIEYLVRETSSPA